jgi:nucleoside-diphosphate-sugar epimerase
MKVFVAGATGAIGKRLVPQLRERGHEVVAASRSMGVDVLDREGTIEAVKQAQPDVIVHQATALSSMGANMRRFDRDFAQTNKLRTEGTDNLLAAARAAGVRRFVAQSFAGWPAAWDGPAVKSEDDPFEPNPPKVIRPMLDAIRHLEAAVTRADGIEGIALRYGGFYGPGTSLTRGGVHYEAVRKRQFPIAGSGAGLWSFIHIDDAAVATAFAVERGDPGVYNVVDDEPAPVSVWLPELAEIIGAKRPFRVPVWVARLLGGEMAVAMMTKVRGASNAKAKRDLNWEPGWPTWREGFRATMGASQPTTTTRRAGSPGTSSTASSR